MQHLNSYFFLQKLYYIYMKLVPKRVVFTLYLLVLSANIFCKQFGTRSDPTKRQACSGSKLFDPQILFLKEFFKKVEFEKNQQTAKKNENYPVAKSYIFLP